ncbi:GAF domain-containing protein [Rhizobium ruizarguesonis]
MTTVNPHHEASLINGRSPTEGVSVDVEIPGFETVAEICKKAYGYRLFTILRWCRDTGEIERIYTTNPADYPVLGRKPMGPTPWGAVVLTGGKAWVGNGRATIRWAFPDSLMMAELGCDACACAPVLKNGKTVGLISMADTEGSYSAADLDGLSALASLLVPCFEDEKAAA